MLMNFCQVFKKYLPVCDQTQGSSAVFALLYMDISTVYWGEGGREVGLSFSSRLFCFCSISAMALGMYHVTTTSHHSFQVHETLLVF